MCQVVWPGNMKYENGYRRQSMAEQGCVAWESSLFKEKPWPEVAGQQWPMTGKGNQWMSWALVGKWNKMYNLYFSIEF